MLFDFDIIVVGAGHAGSEAASAAANMGARVLLITMDMTKIAYMSCNPAMGGIAKGQIIREIDALGGFSGIVSDKSMIQFRMLNKSKGPALWSPRAQCDRSAFTMIWRKILENNKNIHFWQDTVTELLIEKNVLKGVKTRMGVKFYSKAVILTSGTFENGLMHVGSVKIEGGRAGEPNSKGISTQLKEYGFLCGRMKTGTPARIDGRSVDFSKMDEQKGDNEGRKFSFLNYEVDYSSHKSCYITFTNPDVHNLLKKGFDQSPLFNGTIKSIGPRYCPSIEDKIRTFYDKDQHQLFLEPEGLNTVEYYINGFSSSLSLGIQYEALKKIRGLENVRIFRPGYAIEYDYYPSQQLYYTLETRIIENLYFAGQINGTTGYEEAAAQGLIAGINAVRKIRGMKEFILNRDQAYIGVLIDDLITKDIDEPYRMFTSRAEYRLLLRQDDADERLTNLGIELGLVDKERASLFKYKIQTKSKLIELIKSKSVSPDQINGFLERKSSSLISQKVKIIDILKRTDVSIFELVNEIPKLKEFTESIKSSKREILESIEIQVKYEGYIKRERVVADKIRRLDSIKLSPEFDYNKIKSISIEARQKLNRLKPDTIGKASKISGVSPADINILLLYMGR